MSRLRLLLLVLLVAGCGCGGGGGGGGRAPVVVAAPSSSSSMCGAPVPAPKAVGARQVVNTFHSKAVSAIAFASDGRLATTSLDETIRIWDPVKRALLATQHDPIFRHVDTLRWDRAHAQFVVGSFNIEGVGLTNGMDAPRIFHAPFGLASYSEKAKRWVGTADDAVHLFDESTCVGTLVAARARTREEMSPDGRWLGVLRKGQGIDLHDLTSVTPSTSRRVNVGDATAFTFSNDGETLLSASSLNEITITAIGAAAIPQTARVLRVSEADRIVDKNLPEWSEAGELAVSLDGSMAVVSSINHFAVWDLRGAGKRLWTRKFGLRSKGAHAGKIAISPTAPLLVTLGEDFALYDIRDGRDLGELGAAVEPKRRVAIQGDRLVSAGEDVVTVYSLSELDRVARHKIDPTGIGEAGQYGHMVVDDLSFSASGLEISTRYQAYPSAPTAPWGDGSRCERPNKGGDGLVRRVEQFDLPSATKTTSTVHCDPPRDGDAQHEEQFRKRLAAMRQQPSRKKAATCSVTPAALERGSISRSAFSKDGRRAMAVAEDDLLSIGAVDSGPIQTKRFDAAITALSFGGHGELFVGLSNGKLLRVSASDGKPEAEGSTGDNEAIALIRVVVGGDDEKTSLVTIGEDSIVRVWDPKTLLLRASIVDFVDGSTIAFTPGGAYAGSPDIAARVNWVFDDRSTGSEAFSFEQFARFHDPGTVKRRLRGESVDTEGVLVRPPQVKSDLVTTSSGGAEGKASMRIHVESKSRVDVLRGS